MAKQYGQRDLRWRFKKMGDGTGTIGSFGCLLTSLVNGLNRKGWGFTPASIDDFLKRLKLNTIGPYKNYIDYGRLAKALPTVFTGYEGFDPYPGNNTLYELVNHPDKVIVARVNARGIGGSGDHFVLVTEYSKVGGIAKIYDPWTNTEELITKKYNRYNNLLGFRVFEVKHYK